MQSPPALTDRNALVRFRARAQRFSEPAMFLQQEAMAQLHERLNEVNRTFTKTAIVTGFPEIWQKFSKNALILPDDEVLGLEKGSFDLVIHAMSLHWANDPVGQLIQCRQALKPDGLFLGVCFGGETLTELRIALSQAEVEITGGLSPRILPMGEIRDLGALLQRTEFAMPVADTDVKSVSYADMGALLHDLRAMGEVNALAQRRKQFAPRELFTQAAKLYADTYGDDQGRVLATFEMIYLTGWASDESQPKPLRPGSATTRLEDALKSRI